MGLKGFTRPELAFTTSGVVGGKGEKMTATDEYLQEITGPFSRDFLPLDCL